MNPREIATLSVFAALTVALNLSPFKFPFPYLPFLYYQVWEIPIITAFALYGLVMAVAISIINTITLLALFPGALPTGPLYNLAAILGTLLGVHVAYILFERLSLKGNVTLGVLAAGLGVLFRVIVMLLVNWTFIRYPPPIGFSMTNEAVLTILPFVAFFNATLALYTIPAGYMLARAISSRIKLWSP